MKLRFTTRDIFLSMALFAAGMFSLMQVFSAHMPMRHFSSPILWLASGAFIGAAIFKGIGETAFGIAIGLVVQLWLLAFALIFERCIWG